MLKKQMIAGTIAAVFAGAVAVAQTPQLLRHPPPKRR